jgi:protein-tyrosine phosphatase
MKRHVEFQRLHNFRDLGGYRASDSRTVPWQALYRSDSLGKLQGADWERGSASAP